MKPILVLQTGDADKDIMRRHGNFDQMFVRFGNLMRKPHQVIHVERGEVLRSPLDYSGVLVTGSPAMVTDRCAWSKAAGEWLKRVFEANIPIFAVCYGHQLLADALGGVVDYHEKGMELGTQEIVLTEDAKSDALLSSLPPRFSANLLHSQTVVVPPQGATVLAYSKHDPHQILRYGKYAMSTQFHPEFDGEIMRDYVALECSRDPNLPKENAVDTPEALGLMQRFIEMLVLEFGKK
ncbi:MAG: glutamine amidotransferase [Burkholderiales bacterium]|jgi:GMP synthase (glutamine-hydrolysing)|nr:glutamine amidotransferase [Burkholderiales bacterium]